MTRWRAAPLAAPIPLLVAVLLALLVAPLVTSSRTAAGRGAPISPAGAGSPTRYASPASSTSQAAYARQAGRSPAPGASVAGRGSAALPAATPAQPGLLALDAVTPPVTGPGVTTTVTGTVTARAGALADASVRVVLGTSPVVTRASVSAWATSTAPLAGLELASARIGPIAAGASAPFSIAVPPGRLVLNRTFGVIPVAVQVRDSASSVTETLRTFVGWQRSKQYEAIRLAVVAPVTLSPTAALFGADTARRVAAWETELGPTGRIARLLDGTEVDGPSGPVPVTWAVDPAVLGPESAAPGGTDPVSAVVTPLKNRLAAAAGRHPLWALPAADPDLAATLPANPADPTVIQEIHASTRLGAAIGAPAATGVAWPVDGSFEPPREAALRQAYQGVGLSALLGSSSALPAVSGYSGQAPRRTPGGLTLLAWDDELSRLAAQTATPAQGALTAQRLVAETAAILGESPGVARSFLIAIPRTVDPDVGALRRALGALATTPWVRFVSTAELQQQAATQDPVASMSAGSWDQAGPAQVDAARLARITQERAQTAEVASILGPNGDSFRAQWSTALDQLVSARWRSDPAELAQLDALVAQAASSATRGISVAPQTTNFLADEGTLQVTVVNDLGVGLEGVRLVLAPTNPRLRILAQPEPFQIGARSRAVVPVRAQALAAGLVQVTATLTTGDGTPVGVPGTITVRANPPGFALYTIGGAVVLVLLVVGTIRTLRRPRPSGDPPTASVAPGPGARNIADDRA